MDYESIMTEAKRSGLWKERASLKPSFGMQRKRKPFIVPICFSKRVIELKRSVSRLLSSSTRLLHISLLPQLHLLLQYQRAASLSRRMTNPYRQSRLLCRRRSKEVQSWKHWPATWARIACNRIRRPPKSESHPNLGHLA